MAMGLAWAFQVSAGNLGDVRIVGQRHHRELPVVLHEGQRYVAGQTGDEFSIVVSNRSDGDLLAVMSVDGVNVVSGETAATGQSGYVIEAGQTLEVKGWRKSMQRVASFFFTDQRNAYATRTGRPENTGIIGVALFQRKRSEPEVSVIRPSPSNEQSAAGRDRSDRAPAASAGSMDAQTSKAEESRLGTGHGRQQSSHAQYVAFERQSDTPDELITIEYDTRSNLVARGILPPAYRKPTPFPARFVQDPPC
jgi:hypothetical protein